MRTKISSKQTTSQRRGNTLNNRKHIDASYSTIDCCNFVKNEYTVITNLGDLIGKN